MTIGKNQVERKIILLALHLQGSTCAFNFYFYYYFVCVCVEKLHKKVRVYT